MTIMGKNLGLGELFVLAALGKLSAEHADDEKRPPGLDAGDKADPSETGAGAGFLDPHESDLEAIQASQSAQQFRRRALEFLSRLSGSDRMADSMSETWTADELQALKQFSLRPVLDAGRKPGYEIEITQAMMDAGLAAFWAHDPPGDLSSETVAEIFRSMVRAQQFG